MAAFFVLPPRPALGDQLARLLGNYSPGLRLDPSACVEAFAALVAAAGAYPVFREDLPDGDVVGALADGYGAEPGDPIYLVGLGARPDQPRIAVATADAA